MKKLLTLTLVSLSVLSGFSQQWKLFGNPGQLPSANDHAFTVLDNNRPVVAYLTTANEVEVQAWNGAAWILLDPVIPGEQAQNIDIVHIGNTPYVGFFNETQSKYQVFFWDGMAWQILGDTGVNSPYNTGTGSLEVSESQPGIYFTYIDGLSTVQVKKWDGFSWSVFDADFILNPYGATTASEGNKVYTLTDAFPGNYELQLYNSAETSGPYTQYGGGPLVTDPYYYDLDVSPGTEAAVCFNSTALLTQVKCQRTNGTGFDSEPPLDFIEDVTDLSIALDGNDSLYVATEDAAGLVEVRREDNGNWQLVGSGPVLTNFGSPIDLQVFEPSNKPYLTSVNSIFSAPEIRTFNHQPTYFSDAGVVDICQDAVNENVLSSIIFNDQDHDSVFVEAVSQTPSVIASGNITVNRINPYSPSSPTNEFEINVTPEAGASGTASIVLWVMDGLDTLPYTISVVVDPQPTANAGVDQANCADAGSASVAGAITGATGLLWTTSGSGTFSPTNTTATTSYIPSAADITGGVLTLTLTTTGNGACIAATDDMVLTIDPLPTVSAGADQDICAGDNTTISATGASTYTWDQGLGAGTSHIVSPSGTTIYTVTGTDGNGCVNTDQTTITVNALPTVNGGADTTLCEGESLTLAGTGTATGYSWDNGISDGVPFNVTTTTTYTVTGTDGNACQNTDQVVVTVNAAPPAYSLAGTDPSTCGGTDGVITISGVDVSTVYDIYYNDGGVQGPITQTSTAGGTLTITNLGAGSYSDFIMEGTNGCQTTNAGPVNISDPSAPNVIAPADMTVCEGETIVLEATNADNAWIDWDNNVIDGANFTASTTTTYTVTATSAGCTATDQTTVTVHPKPNISIVTTPATCNTQDGTATATISGGSGGYDIYWSNGANTTSINNLHPSLFYINVVDDSGCYAMDVATVTSSAMTVSGTTTDNSCPGESVGAIDLTVSGNGPFTYYWSNGATTEDLSGLTAGQYEVQIQDVNGCVGGASFMINEPDPIVGALSSTQATCGVSDGIISAAIGGGTGPYTYQWLDEFGASIAGKTTNTYSTAPAGMYGIEVTDANNCTNMFYGTVSEANGPVVTIDSVLASTCNDDGLINIDINSTVAINSITWSTGQTTEDISNVGAGDYHVNVEDVNGCVGMLHIPLPAVLPDAVPICIVTVDTSTNTNRIVWEKPLNQDHISHFNIYRESSVAGMFQLVDSWPYANTSEYTDSIAYAELRSWRYKLTTVDTCGNESEFSPVHKTMHITQNNVGSTYNIYWDQYEGFSYPEHTIWRYTDADGMYVLVTTVSATTLTYSEIPPSTAGLDYIVTVDPPSTCTSVDKAQDYNSSRSNNGSAGIFLPDFGTVDEVEQIGIEIYPNPSNGLFNLSMNEFDSYEIKIYDLSGQLVYANNMSGSQYQLDLSDYSRGAYTLEVTSEKGQAIKKLIVQ